MVNLKAMKLHIYDEHCTEFNIAEHGIARFALNENSLRVKMLSDSSYEAQVVVKSFTMSNTRKGNTKFREIIPAAQHDRNQVMVLYTMSGGSEASALAIITVDSPQVILAFDPLFAILDFLMSPFTSQTSGSPSNNDSQTVEQLNIDAQVAESSDHSSALNFRFDLHDVAVSILENESSADSQALHLTIKQLLLSQQASLHFLFRSFWLRFYDREFSLSP